LLKTAGLEKERNEPYEPISKAIELKQLVAKHIIPKYNVLVWNKYKNIDASK